MWLMLREAFYWLHKATTRAGWFQAFHLVLFSMSRLLPVPLAIERIRIVALWSKESDTMKVMKDARNALELIRDSDRRRFQRIRRNVGWIVFGAWKNFGFYSPFARVCGLRSRPRPDDEQVAAVFFACLLVHEPTHGLLERKRFSYTSKNRIRLERICLAEEQRFLSRFPKEKPAVQKLLRKKSTTTDPGIASFHSAQ